MQYLIDILGSSVIGLYFVYMIVNFNIKMSDSLNDSVVNNITSLDAIELGRLLDHDFNKIGFRVDSDDIFTTAKADELKFFTDIDNNGSQDSVLYILGTTKDAAYSDNPYDKPLLRIVNNSDTTLNLVNSFLLAFLDSNGTEITPISSLNSKNKRKKIRSISVEYIVGSPMIIENEFQEVECEKHFYPKNLY